MAVATTLRVPVRSSPPRTALQRHVAFFDPEGTGLITLGQTWRGLGRLGISLHLRLLLPLIINGFLGYLTQGKVSFVVVIAKIAAGRHPFDTGSFGDDGEIDETAFAALSALGSMPGGRAAGGVAGKGAVSAKEMRALIVARGNRRPEMGAVAGALGNWFSAREVNLFFCLAADATKREDGRDVPAVTPRTLRRLFDGSLLPLLARRRRIALRARRVSRAAA